jgi:hypothetical protein
MALSVAEAIGTYYITEALLHATTVKGDKNLEIVL